MTTFKYVVTPFCSPDGILTSLGRVRLRTESGETMRAALETAQLSGALDIRRISHQRMAINDATDVIDMTFLSADWHHMLTPYAVSLRSNWWSQLSAFYA